ncbi:MAG: transglycosylase SLT domain-containing protein [Parashewanella sp.]
MSASIKLVVSTLLLSITFSALSKSPIDIDAEFDQLENNQQQLEQEYKDFAFAYMAEYETWRTEYLKEFDQYRTEIISKWGSGEVSEKHKHVAYTEDKLRKAVIDYQNNEVTIAVLVDENTSKVESANEIKKAIKQLSTQKNSAIKEIAIDKQPTAKNVETEKRNFSKKNEKQAKKVIIEQTKQQLTEIDKESDAIQLVKKDALSIDITARVAAEKKKKLLNNAKTRLIKLKEQFAKQRQQQASVAKKKIVKYTFSLPKNTLPTRAKTVVNMASQQADKWKISPALIMAIIHSESSFDPKATSPIPAYGLMQIVPTTAGYDVNKLVRKINHPMSSAELYSPNINVETGSAYLNILDKRYLKLIKNDTARLYCMIAAYNTGAGNVARAFNPNRDRNINKAIKLINQKSPEEVYQQLLANLPYDETKHYLKKVTKRIGKYQPHFM